MNDVQPLIANEPDSLANLLADPQIYSPANALGRGFDVNGPLNTLNTTSLRKPIVELKKSKVSPEFFTLFDKPYRVWNCVRAMPQSKVYHTVEAYMSRDELQKSFSEHLGFEVSYAAFSAEMKTNYSMDSSNNTQFAYGCLEHYAEFAILTLENATSYLDKYFLDCVNRLPSTLPSMPTEEDLSLFVDFFKEFGVYYTTEIVLGGKLGLYSAVRSEANMKREEIKRCMDASYKSLVTSVSIKKEIKDLSEWKTYTSYKEANSRAFGGDTSFAAQLNDVDPSNNTWEAFKSWAKSVPSDPAIIKYTLGRIWELCGDKRPVVHKAWECYGSLMRPAVSVVTQSSPIEYSDQPKLTSPSTVTVAGEFIRPPTSPASPVGWRIVVLDGHKPNLRAPSAVLLDRFYCVPPDQRYWGSNNPDRTSYCYTTMYNLMFQDIVHAGTGNVLIAAAFNLDTMMLPTQEVIGVLRNAGGGAGLDHWIEKAVHPGVQRSDVMWVYRSVAYLLVGVIGAGEKSGVEFFDRGEFKSKTLNVVLYRQAYGGTFTVER